VIGRKQTMHAHTRPTLYEQLQALPEGLTGEILYGQLHTQPRPTGPHGRASVRLDRTIGRFFDDGDGGPGGWWILIEPEIHLVRDTEVAVPDLAGWQRGRMPRIPEDHRFIVVPDWVCEILSASTESKDRRIKMPLYARFGVAYAWLVDPLARTLEAYALADGEWRAIGRFADNDRVCVEPFDAVTINLADLWVTEGPP
jgi:Uma2 family endonuclease